MTATATSYTKLRNGSWGIKGSHLRAGAGAVVYKRSGERTTVVVDKVLWAGPDGTQIASIRSNRATTRTSSYQPQRRGYLPRGMVGGVCQSCGNEVWDCDC